MDATARARLSLEGLSVGDALGERFFGPPGQTAARIEDRQLPPAPWGWTDDTQMALSIVEALRVRGAIDPDDLAERFASRYEPHRGYGGGAHQLLQSFRRGVLWNDAAPAMFGGQGSYGNGAAMRIAPLGAHFADERDDLSDLADVVDQAARSAKVTHAHPEGIAGAIAVAVAAAVAWRQGRDGSLDADELLAEVLQRTPSGETRRRIAVVTEIPGSTAAARVAERVGSGQEVAAHDTVPFALWCAAHHLDSYEEAFWATVSGFGDRDTTCAMVGGIVALSSGHVPEAWVASREPLPAGF